MKRNMRRSSLVLLLIVALAISVSVVQTEPKPVYAATFVVNNINDAVDLNPGDGVCRTNPSGDPQCTLRAAIQEANAFPGADVIQVPAGTYTLSIAGNEDSAAAGDLDVPVGSVTIVGAGAGTTIIDANGIDRVFQVIGGTLELRDLTVTGGNIAGDGGGIYNDVGSVVLRGVNIVGNDATRGGGIFNRFGSINVLDSSVIGSQAQPNTAFGNGGGIFSQYNAAQTGNTITIERSTVQYNTSGADGGGVYVTDDGDLIITSSTIANNTATVRGGGIFVADTTTDSTTVFSLTDSTVDSNAANGVGTGGIQIEGVTAPTITTSTISNNTSVDGAGGLSFAAPLANFGTITLAITGATFTNNDSTNATGGITNAVGNNASNTTVINLTNTTITDSDGAATGGIFNEARGTLNITRSTISSNDATGTGSNGVGGALNNRGTVTILESTLSNNSATVYGGAIVNRPNATLTINRSTLNGNTNTGSDALGGGAILNNGGELNINNSTISGNTTSAVGGGIANLVLSVTNGIITVESSTIASNGSQNGGGVYNETTTTNLRNTILADNTASGAGPNCNVGSGAINSQGWVLVQNDTGCTITEVVTTGNRFNVQAGLLALANNGGPTFTHRLNPATSGAIDAGANCQIDPPAPNSVDQRGTGFFRPVDIPTIVQQPTSDGCDIGAFEVQSTTNTILGNFVFDDLNANGLQDVGEPGIDGFRVNLYDSTGTNLLATTVTASGGIYSFNQVIQNPPGTATFIIEFDIDDAITNGIVAADSGFTLQNVGGDDEIDSDADPSPGVNRGRVVTPPLQGGDTNLSIDAGIITPGSLGDFVWQDTNGNGIQDVGEPGIGGVIVTLFTAGGSQVAQQVTLDDLSGTPGRYLFDSGLITAGSYYLEFTIPSPALDGFVFTLANQGGNDAIDSDADFITGRTDIFTLESGQDILDFDAGVYELGALNGFVWDDVNGDGLYQIGIENPVQAALVELVNTTTGLVDYSQLTDANGLYVFDETITPSTGILPGTYDVVFTPPAPFDSFTIRDANGGSQDDIDSDVDRTTGSFDGLLIQSGTTVDNLSAGIYQSGTIEGFIFNDLNTNAVYDGAPPDSIFTGGAAVTLRLRNGDGDLLPDTRNPDPVLGTYSFTGLVPGSYIIEIVLPAGTVLVTKDAGPDTTDSDFNQSNNFSDVLTVNSGQTISDIDAGLQPSVALSGTVWNDANVNGLQDGVGAGGETGQANVPVRVFALDGFSLIAETTTDGSGNYSFASLPAGQVVVAVQPPSGRGFTTVEIPPTINSDVNQYTGRTTVTLQQGVSNDVDAGLVDAFQIGNFIFEDTDADGIQDSGSDPGLQGITIRLLSALENNLGELQSSPTGNYAFYLTPGLDYILEFVQPSGYVFTQAQVGADRTIDSDPVYNSPTTARVTFTAVATDNTLDAGLYQLNSVSGFVWNDTNANGLRDPGELGENGVTVTLLDGNGQPLSPPRQVTTSGSGAAAGGYSFVDLPAGSYTLAVTPPTGRTFTFQDVNANGDDDRDSDVNANTGRLTFILTSDQDASYFAGLVDGVSINGTVWADLDADGRQDDVPLDGVPGVTVNLYRTTGGIALLGSTITDANGDYIFTVDTNDIYIIEVVLPASYRRVPADVDQVGMTDIGTDSDTSETDGRVTVEVLTVDVDVDAGLEPLSLIGDFVWDDLNGNGIQDSGEPGVSGITVRLLDSTGNPLVPPRTTTTDANGFYQFVDLLAGDYIVEFVAPAQRFFTSQNNGGNPNIPDDSDPDPGTGRTPVTTLTAGERDTTIDAGLQPPAQIGGFVWNDTNNDGIQDGGETGRSGVTVRLLDSAGAPLVPPVSTITNGSGVYLFTNLQTGDYIVEFVAPTGFAFTLQDQGADEDLDSEVNVGGRTAVISLAAPNLQRLNIDAGLVQGSGIGNFVWNDLDQDGIQDAGEPGVQGVTVNLLNGTGNPFVPPVSTTTDATGAYNFPTLFPGDYIVEFVLPAGATSFSPQNQGDGTNDSDPDASGLTSVITIAQGTPNNNIDAGIIFPISLEMLIWDDLDGDGIQDAGETATGLGGASVDLYLVGSPDVLIATEVSGATAAPNVVFDSNTYPAMVTGTYYVIVTPPSGYALSPVDTTGDDLDSDTNPTTGRSPNFSLASGTTLTNVDAGAFTATIIGGQAFIDTDVDGIQDVGEIGYNGLIVNIYTIAGGENLLFTTTTTGGGLYSFGVPDGTYIIEFVDPGASITFSTANVGGDDSVDSDASILTGRTAQFPVPGGSGTVTDLSNIDVGLSQSGLEPLAVTKSYETAAVPPLQGGDELFWVICARNVNLSSVDGVVITDEVDVDTQIIEDAFYGIGSACPTGIPTDADFNISGPTAVPAGNIEDDGTVTMPTLNGVAANQVVILIIRVTIAEPGSVYVPTTETGALAMSSILLLLGALFQPLLNRRRLAVALCIVLALIMVLAPFSQSYADNITGIDRQATQQTETGRWVRLDSHDPSIQQVGSWETVSDPNATGGSYLSSTDPNAALTLPAAGTQVRLQYVALPNSAAISVYAANQQIGLVEDYADGARYIASSSAFNIPSGDDVTLRVQNAGYSPNLAATEAVLAIDAIDIWIPVDANADELSNLTGIVWQDSNNNGQLDGSDNLLSGIIVDLYLDFGTNDTFVATSATDEYGRYQFTGLLPDTYFIVVDRDSIPADLDPTSVNWSPITVQAPYDGGDIVIPNGAVAPSYDQLGGMVYLDTDQSNTVSDNDTPLSSVEVNLYLDDGDRVFDPGNGGDFVVSTTTSGADGAYLFDQILSGIYWLEVNMETLPAAADPNQVWRLLWVRVPEISEANLLLLPAPETYTVDGGAYLDNNYNDEVDTDDAPLGGLTLNLYAENGDGYFSEAGDSLVGTVTTADDGSYSFDRLSAGIHWLMPDMDNLPAAASADQYWPALWIRVPNISETNVLLLPAPAAISEEGNGTVTGLVFNDDNGNRRYDSRTESGISNAVVRIFRDDGDAVFTGSDVDLGISETDGNGEYTFDGLLDGVYWIVLEEDSLPDDYMDTVGYGGHGDQNPAEFTLTGANGSLGLVVDGPRFAYALDTDHDGSPDGREGSGDRDNDNIPNYMDAYDPTGIIYGADILGNTLPLVGVEVSLVYYEAGQPVLADTIQPNPQLTGSNGEYRFDLVDSETGLPLDGSERTFELLVEGVNEQAYLFPSEANPPAGTLRLNRNNGQVAPSLAPDPEEDYFMSFAAQLGDDDIVNNNPVGQALEVIDVDIENTACARFTGGAQSCDTANVDFELEVAFSLDPLTDSATGLANEEITFTHTLTNDGNAPDSYRVTLDSTDDWTQSLEILDGGNTLGTIGRGGSFDTPELAPGEFLTLELTVTVPLSGVTDGDFNNYTIRATSIDSITLGAPVNEDAVDTVTVGGGSITGTVYNDANNNGIVDAGEDLSNVRLIITDDSGTTLPGDVRTGSPYFVGGLPAGTYTVAIDTSTLPNGDVTFIAPTTSSQTAAVVVGETTIADFRLQIAVNPEVIKSASTTSALPGEQITFTLLVRNPTETTILGTGNRQIFLIDPVNTVAFTGVSAEYGTVVGDVQREGLQVATSSQIVQVQILRMGPNSQFSINITATVLSTVTRGQSYTNTARIEVNSVQASSSQVSIFVPAATTEDPDSDGDGVSDSEDPAPNDPTITGQEDFGTGGSTAPGAATGTGEAVADTGADDLPQTGYMPIEYFSQNAEDDYQTTHLSTVGRIVIIGVGILALVMAFIMYRFYNDSEMVYEWVQKRKGMGTAILAVIILSFLLGSFSLIYTANDIAGVVDVDRILGIDNNGLPEANNTDDVNVDGGNTAPTDDETLEARNSATSNDLNGITWVDNNVATQLPSLPTLTDSSQFVIPTLNLYTKLVNAPRVGTTWDVSHFFDEVAFLEGTAPPGVEGNTVIAGHVTHTRGLGPFRTLDQIAIGDVVIVRDYDIEYSYFVTDIIEVAASDIWVTKNVEDDAFLTLVTCSGWNANTRTYATRLIVKAELNKWRIVSEEADAFEQPNGERRRYEIGSNDGIELAADWEELGSFNTSDGSYFYSEDKEASATFTFQGDKFRLSYMMFNNFGEFEVYLDGELIMTVDAYSEFAGYSTTGVIEVTPGVHKLEIRNTDRANAESKGNVIGLDAIDIWG